MPFASIKSTNPRTNPKNFMKKYWELVELKNEFFFEATILNFLSQPFWFIFALSQWKKHPVYMRHHFFSALWMVFPESWKRSCLNFYAHDCSTVVMYRGFYPYPRVLTLPYPWWLAPTGTLPFNTLWKNLKPYPPLTLWRVRVRVYPRVTPLKGRKSPPYCLPHSVLNI